MWNAGIFSSRVGRKVLALFILAAGLPIAVLAILAQHAFDLSLKQNREMLIATSVKSAQMQTIERLRVAKQALFRDIPVTAENVQGSPAPLTAAVSMRSGSARQVMYGDAGAAPLLAVQQTQFKADGRSEHLAVVHTGMDGPQVIIEATDGGVQRLGLVNPDYLWQGAEELPPGVWMCALDATRTPIYCSDDAPEVAQSASARSVADGPSSNRKAERRLFLANDFSADDWTFAAGGLPHQADSNGGFSQMLPAAAGCGLFVALLLGLVQTRRTLMPLAKLAVASRKFAHRDFEARVDLTSNDEYGEVAGAFNEMASQLRDHFDESAVLSALDARIAGRAALTGTLALVAEKALKVARATRVVVGCSFAAAGGQAQTLRRSANADEVDFAPTTIDHGALLDEVCGTAPRRLLPGSLGVISQCFGPFEGMLTVLPLNWRGEYVGFLALESSLLDSLDGETHRRLVDLCLRAATAISLSARDETLLRDARNDGLTGLANRIGLTEHLTSRLALCSDDWPVAILMVDVDRFKVVNDSAGHSVGDQALIQLSRRLTGCVGPNGFLARPAGDEFVVVLTGDVVTDSLASIAQAICDTAAIPIVIDGVAYTLGASVGVTVCRDPAKKPEAALMRADHAMYEVKRQGGGKYGMADKGLDARASKRAWIERDLPFAAERGELRLLYQPRIDRITGTCKSAEALVRWQHPTHGLCSPGDFIPIAEESDLITVIGHWVLDTACAQRKSWRDQGMPPIRVAVNLSARQLMSDGLVGQLRSALARHGIESKDLEVELTEGVFVEQSQAVIARLEEIKALGICIALDDFGTGYSSLAYLKNMPLDVLKIDRAFVKDLGADPAALAVTEAIVALANSLGMHTVAEGIETKEQLAILNDLKCDEYQGFLFSKPVPPDQVFSVLDPRAEAAERFLLVH